MWWCVPAAAGNAPALAPSPRLPLDGSAAALSAARPEAPARTGYRVQQHVAIDSHPGAEATVDQQVDGEIVSTDHGGGREVTITVTPRAGVVTTDFIDVIAKPTPLAPRTTRLELAADGAVRSVVVDGEDGPSAVLQQALGGLVGQPMGWRLPAGELRPGASFRVPIDLTVPVDGRTDEVTYRGALTLGGAADWRFSGWSAVDGVRCAVFEGEASLEGAGAIALSAADGSGAAVQTGIAGQAGTELCWDPVAGEVAWQHAVSDLVQLAGDRFEAQRTRIHAVTFAARLP